MKKILIIVIVLLVASVGFLSGCQGRSIHSIQLKEKPDNFVNMSEEQMIHYPHLKEAILLNKTIDTSSYSYEMDRLRGILDYFDTNFICYRNEYYEILFIYSD